MSSVPNRYLNRKYRYRKSSKMGTGTKYNRYDSVPVRYRYFRVKIGKYRYRTGTENVKSRYRIGTEMVPGSVNSYRYRVHFTHP
ncbi:hypothetical protein Hanom_Chr06g00512611 [Helianthus anomalus]